MGRKFALLLCAVLLTGVSLGCGMCGLAQKGQQVSATIGAIATEASQITLPAPAVGTATSGGETPAPGETPAASEESLDPKALLGNIESLNSYRSRLTMSFEGQTESGEAEKRTMTMETEYVREPLAQRVVIQGSEAAGTASSMELIRIGDQQYALMGDEGGCISSPVGENEGMDTELFKPEDMLGGLEQARRVGTENVNGIRCTHYTFSEKELQVEGLSKVQGDMWVAVEGNYVVKYIVDAEGIDPSTQKSGHINWAYEVRDVNQPITIRPPADCEAAASQYPLMPDATELTTLGGMVMYKSASSLEDVLKFYQEQMPAQGWSESGEAFISEDSAWLTYTKEGSSISISLSIDNGKVAVLIMGE